MALDMQGIGERLIGELLSGSEGMSSAQLVNKLVDDKLQDNGIARDERKVAFIEKINSKISEATDPATGTCTLDAESLAGYRRLIVKYSS